MRQGVNITHGCKVDWRGCGSNAALPAPGWLLQHRAGQGLSLGWLWVTVWQRQGWMVLTWSLLPFQGVLFGFSYLLALCSIPRFQGLLSQERMVSEKERERSGACSTHAFGFWRFSYKGILAQPPSPLLFGKKKVGCVTLMYSWGKETREITPAADEFPLLASV